jgi:hypothetical protein
MKYQGHLRLKKDVFLYHMRDINLKDTREILLRVDIKMPDQPSLSALRKSLDKAVAAYRKFRSHLWSSRIS